MRLFIPSIPEVKLFNDKPGYTASKYLQNFLMQQDLKSRTKDFRYKPIIGEFELNIAMDLIGCGDKNYANIGYIEENDSLQQLELILITHFNILISTLLLTLSYLKL